jgi:hypothetical protein
MSFKFHSLYPIFYIFTNIINHKFLPVIFNVFLTEIKKEKMYFPLFSFPNATDGVHAHPAGDLLLALLHLVGGCARLGSSPAAMRAPPPRWHLHTLLHVDDSAVSFFSPVAACAPASCGGRTLCSTLVVCSPHRRPHDLLLLPVIWHVWPPPRYLARVPPRQRRRL